MTTFTTRQGQFLAYIDAYIRRHSYSPAELDIARHFGISPPSAHQMVVTLETRGLIERTPGQPRSIRVLVPPEKLPATEYGQASRKERPTLDASYPLLARWLKRGGRVEFGRNEETQSMARALDADGIAWDGADAYSTLDDLIRDMNEGLKQWFRSNK